MCEKDAANAYAWQDHGAAYLGTTFVQGPSSSVASEIALFDGTTGKLIKRATGTGLVVATAGVYSTTVAPTFSDFTNANHDHGDTDDGGILTPAAFGLLSIQQTADYTGTNVNTAQKVFNESTNGAATVAASTTYFMEGFYYLRTTGTTSHFLDILFGGTATFTSFDYSIIAAVAPPTTDILAASSVYHKSGATNLSVSNAAATATHHSIWLRGVVRVNGTGTVIPQYQWSAAPGVAGVTGRNSFLRLTPIGSNTVGTVGTWT